MDEKVIVKDEEALMERIRSGKIMERVNIEDDEGFKPIKNKKLVKRLDKLADHVIEMANAENFIKVRKDLKPEEIKKQKEQFKKKLGVK